MKAYTYTENGKTFARISKAAARREFLKGGTVILCPVNLRPGFPYFPEVPVYLPEGYDDPAGAWEQINRDFALYNLYNAETGHYTAYYIRTA
jgi:hypothetical protein